jgi:hypothetical protein
MLFQNPYSTDITRSIRAWIQTKGYKCSRELSLVAHQKL